MTQTAGATAPVTPHEGRPRAARRRPGRGRRWLGRLVAVAAGALTGLAWQPTNLWPLAFVGVALLTVLSGRAGLRVASWWRAALGAGWWFGVGLGAVAIGWVSVIGWYVPIPLIAFMALWQGLTAVVAAAAWRLTRRPVLRAVLAATGWSLAEYGASRVPFGGFGWLRLAYTQVDSPLHGWLPLIGVGGLSFVVALLGALLAALVDHPRRDPGTVGASGRSGIRLASLALPVALAVLLVAGAPLADRIPAGAAGDRVTVGVVQGNVDGSAGPHAMGYARSVTDNHVSETVTLMAKARAGLVPAPDFVLWPENSTDVDPTLDEQTQRLVSQASAIAGVPILVGAVMRGPGPGERQTSGLWWRIDNTPTSRYDKRNLVPFGEWIPLRKQLLPLLPILQEVGAQSVPGTRPGVMQATLDSGRSFLLGDIICFELAWDSTVHDTVTHGAQLLVVQSNNGTYTGTGQPRQQFAITRARAMEMRRDIVVATTNSLSGLVHADGSVTGRTTEGTAAAESFTVPLRTGITPAVRVGPGIELAASVVAALVVVAGFVARRRGRPGPVGSDR